MVNIMARTLGVLSCFILLGILTTGIASAQSTDVTWGIHIDSVTYSTEWNGYRVDDPAQQHFEVVQATFTNTTGILQVLVKPVFSLETSDGIVHREDRASQLPQNYQVGPGQSVQTATVFILTNSECKFTLTSQWDPSFDVSYQSRFPGC